MQKTYVTPNSSDRARHSQMNDKSNNNLAHGSRKKHTQPFKLLLMIIVRSKRDQFDVNSAVISLAKDFYDDTRRLCINRQMPIVCARTLCTKLLANGKVQSSHLRVHCSGFFLIRTNCLLVRVFFLCLAAFSLLWTIERTDSHSKRSFLHSSLWFGCRCPLCGAARFWWL